VHFTPRNSPSWSSSGAIGRRGTGIGPPSQPRLQRAHESRQAGLAFALEALGGEDGAHGSTDTLTRSPRPFSRSCWVPCQSISNSTSRPAASGAGHVADRRRADLSGAAGALDSRIRRGRAERHPGASGRSIPVEAARPAARHREPPRRRRQYRDRTRRRTAIRSS